MGNCSLGAQGRVCSAQSCAAAEEEGVAGPAELEGPGVCCLPPPHLPRYLDLPLVSSSLPPPYLKQPSFAIPLSHRPELTSEEAGVATCQLVGAEGSPGFSIDGVICKYRTKKFNPAFKGYIYIYPGSRYKSPGNPPGV